MDVKKVQLVEKIDRWVLGIIQKGGGDEQILEEMPAYTDTFRQLMGRCSSVEMNLFIQRYEGFYRFTQLLERLAQGIADGTVKTPATAKKARQKHPPQKRKQIRHPMTQLPLFTEQIIGMLTHTEAQYDLFLEACTKPHVLDDATVERAQRAYETQWADMPLFEKQLKWWLSEELSVAQRYQVTDLMGKLAALQACNQKILSLLAGLKQGTINRILEMDDEELGRQFLRGDLI